MKNEVPSGEIYTSRRNEMSPNLIAAVLVLPSAVFASFSLLSVAVKKQSLKRAAFHVLAEMRGLSE